MFYVETKMGTIGNWHRYDQPFQTRQEAEAYGQKFVSVSAEVQDTPLQKVLSKYPGFPIDSFSVQYRVIEDQ